MENKFRNEMEIQVGPEKILLRPTFENIAAMEEHVGGVSYLGWKFSRGAGKTVEQAIKNLPTANEITRIIYFNQAATKPDSPTEKRFSLEEIWDFVQQSGASSFTIPIMTYVSRLVAGSKKLDDVTEEQKKS